VEGDVAAKDGAPIRRIVANRVCAKSSFRSRCQLLHCLIRSLMLPWMQKLCLRWHPVALPRSAKPCRPQRQLQAGLGTAASLLKIYACACLTRHFLACCFKPVTGLIVSLILGADTAPTCFAGNREGDPSIGLFPPSAPNARVYYAYIFTFWAAKPFSLAGLVLESRRGSAVAALLTLNFERFRARVF
jgi:hypothetical protein